MESSTAELTEFSITNSNINWELGDGRSNAILCLAAVKIAIGTTGVLGNAAVLMVLIKLDSEKVKFLLRSQAAIDLLTSAVLIADAFTKLYTPTSLKNSVLHSMYCLLWWSEMVFFVMFAVSTYNLVAISLERYILILHPLYYRAHMTRVKQVLLGAVAWLFAPILQLTYYAIVQPAYDSEGVNICVYKPSPIIDLIGVLLFFWDFFIPCLIMSFCFTNISITLYKQDKIAEGLREEMPTISSTVSTKRSDETSDVYLPDKEDTDKYKRSRNVTKTFIIIFVAFVICWSTNQILFLQKNLGGYNHFGTVENHFANNMALLNCAVNPFIYVLHMKQYQDVVKKFFRFK